MHKFFVLVKPDAVAAELTDAIIGDLADSGYFVEKRERRKLSDDDVHFLYWMLVGHSIFLDLVEFMTSGPSELMLVCSSNSIDALNALIGDKNPRTNEPGTLRAKHGTTSLCNAVHSPNSDDSSRREAAYFFGREEGE